MSNYSWEICTWANLNASYDRIYYHEKFNTFEQALLKRQEVQFLFLKSDKTRLVFNVPIKSNQKQKVLDNKHLFEPWEIEAFFSNGNGTLNEWYETLLIWENKKNRQLNPEILIWIRQKVLDTILNNKNWIQANLDRIQSLVNRWFQFSDTPDTDDLELLWAQTFNWTHKSIQTEIEWRLSTILTLKSPEWEIISLGMVSSSWESTERATNPKYQRQ